MKVVALSLVVAALALHRASALPPSVDADDPETYLVYAAAISHERILLRERSTAPPLVRQDTVRSECQMSEDFPVRWTGALTRLDSRDSFRYQLAPGSPRERPFLLKPIESIREPFHGLNGGWDAFYHEFPDADGFFELSAVGFDDRGTRAIVYLAHYFGLSTANGGCYLLEKRGAVWTIVHELILWMS